MKFRKRRRGPLLEQAGQPPAIKGRSPADLIKAVVGGLGLTFVIQMDVQIHAYLAPKIGENAASLFGLAYKMAAIFVAADWIYSFVPGGKKLGRLFDPWSRLLLRWPRRLDYGPVRAYAFDAAKWFLTGEPLALGVALSSGASAHGVSFQADAYSVLEWTIAAAACSLFAALFTFGNGRALPAEQEPAPGAERLEDVPADRTTGWHGRSPVDPVTDRGSARATSGQ